MSIWHLMSWKMTSNSGLTSESQLTHLVREVLKAKDFSLDDVPDDFNAHTEMMRFDVSKATLDTNGIFQRDSWRESVAEILVPTRERNTAGNRQLFTVPGFHYWPLVAVICAAFSEASLHWFHLTSFKQFWKSPLTGQEQRLYDELYTSDAWNKAHDELHEQKRDNGCQLEWVIAGLMFWSDATHLAQFGNASAWPVYLFFGNQSKYVCACPTTNACHPIAFIPSLPESIVGFIGKYVKMKSISDILTHCKWELFHALWRILLDDEFLDAVLIATIHDKEVCPCPWCFLPTSCFDQLGLKADILACIKSVCLYLRDKVFAAREALYKLGTLIKGTAAEHLLKVFSLVPTLNTFNERLGNLGLDFFPMLVVNLLHEFELGVFKYVFKHLIRLLYAINHKSVALLNECFHSILSFGKGAIQCFPSNVSNDVLQASLILAAYAIPAFEGLFLNSHNEVVCILLFCLAKWHTLAKLQIHTGNSLDLLSQATRCLGQQLQKFQDSTCSAFWTMELPGEIAAHQKNIFNLNSAGAGTGPSGAHPKAFNMQTYKLHALGDYISSIKMFGTTDLYTTQILNPLSFQGELAHQLLKRFYQSTNKQDPPKQHLRESGNTKDNQSAGSPLLLEAHHCLSSYPGIIINLACFLEEHRGDPAVVNFIPKIKDHILSHLLDIKRNDVCFINNLNGVFQPKHFQINYTMYDVCRDQDMLKPGNGSTVMMLSRESSASAHPFWYARVLGAFSINILHVGPNAHNRLPQYMEVLWVQWFGVVPQYHWGFQEGCLPKIGFIPNSPAAFGFLDPSLVIRACHLIPAFADHHTNDLLRQSPSAARLPGEVDDWALFYVNIFTNRDMFCHFAGIGVGHQVQYDLLNIIQHDHTVGGRSTGVSHKDILDDEDPKAHANVDFRDESWQCDRDLDDNVSQDDADKDEDISEDCDSDIDDLDDLDDLDDFGSDSEDEGSAFKF
ncbi:hypothetical protein BDR06DRAFT_980408 [Suillus hirtellus]|nr:hypothetical protein BDR06DRAFT_980408 [Suillus hirtellus]